MRAHRQASPWDLTCWSVWVHFDKGHSWQHHPHNWIKLHSYLLIPSPWELRCQHMTLQRHVIPCTSPGKFFPAAWGQHATVGNTQTFEFKSCLCHWLAVWPFLSSFVQQILSFPLGKEGLHYLLPELLGELAIDSSAQCPDTVFWFPIESCLVC